MKKNSILVVLCLICATTAMAQKAKYVFYFIGDGMGLNEVNVTETYLANIQGKIGIQPLCFASFPYTTYATSFSASSDVTDSAAGGTALATGVKTKNGSIGMNPQLEPISSIADWAKKSGKKVGISTSVSIDHATPAVFYAHQASRNSYFEIGKQAASSNVDYFGGSDFLQPTKDGVDLHQLCEENGYTWAYGYEEAQTKWQKAKRLIMTQTKDAAAKNKTEIPYAIDRNDKDLTLKQIVEMGINFLTKDNKKGFFFMVEGGMIDHACHGDDAATMIHETIAFDEAIQVAYDFYLKHPKETLIVITADHETGGLVPSNGRYELNLQALQHQTCSVDKVTERFNELKKNNKNATWEDAKKILSDCFGLFTKVPVNWRDEAELHSTFEDSFRAGGTEQNWYGNNAKIAAKGRDILNKIAMVSWASFAHSDGYVPIYAIGAGAENFHGRMNNIDIPEVIAKAAGYKK